MIISFATWRVGVSSVSEGTAAVEYKLVSEYFVTSNTLAAGCANEGC